MLARQSLIYKTAQDCTLKADVYLPASDAPCPAIMWLHGGALIFGDRTAIAPDQVEWYVGRGFAVVSVDYRLAPETKLEAIIQDLRDAYAWVRRDGSKRFGIDQDRLALVGHSAGGYLALMSGICVDPPPRALVSFYGYGDIAAPWYTRPDPHYCEELEVSEDQARKGLGTSAISGVPFGSPAAEGRWRFYLYCRQKGLWPHEVSGHDPDAEPEWFDPFCPLRNVTPHYPPTLLIHGELDTDVPFEQSRLMAAKLARNGVSHELLALPGLGHGFDGAGMDDPSVSAAFRRVLAFLDWHLARKPG